MPTDRSCRLDAITVMVTRPQQQQQELAALISQAGGQPLAFPTLEIAPLADQAAAVELIQRLDEFELAIFISANAVEQGVALIKQVRNWPASLALAVVGDSSARALRALGLQATLRPMSDFNSEALLALPELQQVADKRIVIIRGQGGREKLADELRQRGAVVEYLEVYQRRCPDLSLADLEQREQIDVIVTASNETLQNLYQIAGAQYRDWLVSRPLVVISQRCADLAAQLGFTQPACIATEASNAGMLQAICDCVAQRDRSEHERKTR